MIFPPRKLMKSYSDQYRQVQIPRPVSALWIAANVEYISIEYVDAEDCMVIRPIWSKVRVQFKLRPGRRKKQSQLKKSIPRLKRISRFEQ